MIALLLSVCLSTAIADDKVVRIALGSCAHQDSSQEIWSSVQSWKPDLFVHLGDAVYADTRDPLKMRAIYDQAASNRHLRSLRSSIPFLSTWDDHDYGENDAGASYPMRAASERLFFGFWKDQADSIRTGRQGVYGSSVVRSGDRIIRVIALDTRYFRSDWSADSGSSRRYRPDPDPDKTILGEEQWAWLGRELEKPADLTMIASSIQVVNDEHGWECWGNFPAERRRLFELIDSAVAGSVLIISGDRHFSELSRDNHLYDFTSSGLTQIAESGHTVRNSKRVGEAVSVQNFGGVVVDFNTQRLTFLALDRSGEVKFEHTVLLLDLGPMSEEREQ